MENSFILPPTMRASIGLEESLNMAVPARLFSLDEANALLSKLEAFLQELAEKRESYAKQHDVLFMSELLQEAERNSGKEESSDQDHEDIKGFEDSIENFESDLDRIRKLGCILRNLEKGIVEFPGKYQGDIVYFCWRRGESQILFYRPFKSNPNQRIPLPIR